MNRCPVPRRNQCYFRVLSLFCIISGFYILFYYYNLVDPNLELVSGIWSTPDGEKLRTASVLEQDSKTVLVLIWTSFFGRKAVSTDGITFNRESYPDCFRHCEITDDLSKLDQADAVIFHALDTKNSILPKSRGNGQLWVLLDQESPFVTGSKYDSFSGFFNWTMTYRMDSDVFHPYGAIEEISNSIKDDKLRSEIDSLVSGKTKLVAGAISNCQTQSHRETLVSELKTHIPVDIYGNCGIGPCGRDAENCSKVDFWKEISRQYKFFLAFENALCVDYVTEKLFRTLKLGIVPVVYGAANYTKFAPPHSFIDVSDFKSPTELAEFLTKLDQNVETEYRKYFEWRLTYKVKSPTGYCTLCKKLKMHRLKKLEGTVLASRTYHFLDSWWLNYPPPIESLPGEKKIGIGSSPTAPSACKGARY